MRRSSIADCRRRVALLGLCCCPLCRLTGTLGDDASAVQVLNAAECRQMQCTAHDDERSTMVGVQQRQLAERRDGLSVCSAVCTHPSSGESSHGSDHAAATGNLVLGGHCDEKDSGRRQQQQRVKRRTKQGEKNKEKKKKKLVANQTVDQQSVIAQKSVCMFKYV